jgi:hypothetical protein
MRTALLALLSAGLALAADPFVGTWKPVPAKWKSDAPPDNTYRTLTIKWEAAGQDQYLAKSFTPDGKPRMGSDGKPTRDLRHFFDGKEHPRGTGAVIGQRLSENDMKETVEGPKGTVSIEYVVSPDGKTLTQTTKGNGNDTGRPLDEVLVYEKQ